MIEVVVTSTAKWIVITAIQIPFFRYILGLDLTLNGSAIWGVFVYILSIAMGYGFRRFFTKHT